MLSKKWNARMLTVASTTVLGLGAASVIHAGTQTANLPVTATVAANCAISTAAVAFGAYDPAVANAATDLLGTRGRTYGAIRRPRASRTPAPARRWPSRSTARCPPRRTYPLPATATR
jgi:hypothetical protein